MKVFTILLIIMFFINPIHAKKRGKRLVSPESGTYHVSGEFYYSYDSSTDENSNTLTGGIINISPKFGIFFNESIDLELGTNIFIYSGSLYENNKNILGFDVGSNYYLKMSDSSYLSFGALLNYNKSLESFITMGIKIPVRVLFALKKNIALTVGIVPTYYFSKKNENLDVGTGLSIPIGVLGIRIFI